MFKRRKNYFFSSMRNLRRKPQGGAQLELVVFEPLGDLEMEHSIAKVSVESALFTFKTVMLT